MKFLSLLIAMSLPAAPAAASGCFFGGSTWDLEESFEQPSAAREFYKGEHFSLSRPHRLNGLNELEKGLIEIMMKENGDLSTLTELLKEFSQTDGYLMYFSHAPSGRQFVQIAHYPGDNENGAVFEIVVEREGTRVLGQVARIQDSQFAACAPSL